MQAVLQNAELPIRLFPLTPWSDDELIAFSKANKPCKVERLTTGEIRVMTPSGFSSNIREAYVVSALVAWADADGRGEAFSSNAGFKLPNGATLSPDAGWIDSTRLDALTEAERERFLPFAPDFLIEILSPSDSLPELDAKLAWRIDPFGRTVAIFSADAAPQVLNQPEVVEGTGPVAGFQLKMTRVWAQGQDDPASYFAERASRANLPEAIELPNRAGVGNTPIEGDELHS